MSFPSQDDLRHRVFARMKELSGSELRWHRSLWSVSTLTSLDELVEAAGHTWNGVLSSEHALSDFKSHAIRSVSADPGVGAEAVRAKLLAEIKSVGPTGEAASRNAVSRVVEMRRRLARDYLRNWAAYIEDGNLADSTVEIAARSIVTHIRSLGYSRHHILKWLENRGRSLGVEELAREAAKNLRGDQQGYVFKVPSDAMAKIARHEKTLPVSDFPSAETFFGSASNHAQHDYSSLTDSQSVEFTVMAADPFSALASLRRQIDGILTRMALATGSIADKQFPLVLETTSNKIHEINTVDDLLTIRGLQDWKLITALDGISSGRALEEALHLLAPHLQSTHGMSVATLWATSEALLGRAQQGGHHVARHLAEILTCAYPRHLAYDLLLRAKDLKKAGVGLDCRTKGKGTFLLRDFCDDLARGNPGFTDPNDLAALARYQAVTSSPKATLGRVKQHLESLFLRVYYHRNFVMHSAKTNSVSLLQVAGIAPVLVAAALNEIVTGIARDTTPSALAERAAVEISLLETDGQRSLLSLLT